MMMGSLVFVGCQIDRPYWADRFHYRYEIDCGLGQVVTGTARMDLFRRLSDRQPLVESDVPVGRQVPGYIQAPVVRSDPDDGAVCVAVAGAVLQVKTDLLWEEP